jgi:hypothetical protein
VYGGEVGGGEDCAIVGSIEADDDVGGVSREMAARSETLHHAGEDRYAHLWVGVRGEGEG